MNSTDRQLASGALYTAIAKYSGMVISLAVSGVLAHQLPPEYFGTVAVATVIIAFFAIFSDLGIAPAIIQKQDLDKSNLSDIFSFTIWSGLLLSVLFFFSSTAIAHFYKDIILIPICQLLSLNLFFASANIVPNALLLKAKRFRFIACRTLIVQSICGVIAIVAVLEGAGIYSLLINPILSSIILFTINYIQYPQTLKFTSGRKSLKKIFSYSAFQFLFNVINYFSRNLDNLLIGKYIGMTQLGFYEKSYRLMMLPLQNITHIITPVMHPVFAEHQNNKALIALNYERVVRLLAFIGFPLSVVLFFTANELILLIFGQQWTASVPIFEILALSVGVQVILSSSGSIFQATNATKILFLSGLLSTILNIIAICIGIFLFKTLEAVATSIVISFSINFIQCYLLMYRVIFHLSMKNFFRQLISPLLLSVGLFIILIFVSKIALPLLLSLIVKGALSLLITLSYIQLMGEYDLKKLLKR